jgi:gas vesicle protein
LVGSLIYFKNNKETRRVKIMSKTLLKIVTLAAAGFAAGILLAPKSGKETRQDIKNKALDAKKYAEEKADLAKAIGTEGFAAVKTSAKHAGEEATEFAQSTKVSASVVAKEASKLGAEAKARAKRVAADAKRTAKQVKKDAKTHLK